MSPTYISMASMQRSTCCWVNNSSVTEVADLQREGPSSEEVQTLLTLEQRTYESQVEENSFWLDLMAGCYQGRSWQKVCSMCNPVIARYICTQLSQLQLPWPA